MVAGRGTEGLVRNSIWIRERLQALAHAYTTLRGHILVSQRATRRGDAAQKLSRASGYSAPAGPRHVGE